MRSKHFVRLSRFVVSMTLLLGIGSVSARQYQADAAQQARDNAGKKTGVTTIRASEADQKAALAEWSREMRAAAEPLAMPEFDASDVPADAAAPAAVGEPDAAEGGAPAADAEARARQEFAEDWALIEEQAASTNEAETFGTAGVYTSYLGNYHSQLHRYYPYVAVGKLYISGGGYCTASVISPYNIIVTAAHCVYNTNTNSWYGGWTFVPADRAGAAPYGSFPWSSATVLNAWINAPSSSAGYPYDVAVIRLGNNSAGRPVTYYTGYLGRSWNYGYVQSHHAIGYPSNLSSGNYTYICVAESFYQSTEILGMGCNMMHGSSGGPWIRKFAPYTDGAVNYVNSVVSHGISGSTWGNTFYGPRFNSNNIVVLCNVAGC